MVIETEIEPFLSWLSWGVLRWLLVVGSLTLGAVLIGWLVAAVRHGPVTAVRMTGGVLAAGVVDLVMISPRRLFALSWLAVKESIRRRVVVVFAVFILILLFAGWFLDPGSDHPARLYLSFALTATSYLVLLMALFLSALSLPGDIKNKTLHTVVTKPVRPSEVVLGRMLGFAIIGTMLLLIMGTISYVFVIRGLAHSHELPQAELARAEKVWGEQLARGEPRSPLELSTTKDHGHRHNVYIDPTVGFSGEDRLNKSREAKGTVKTGMEQGHWHEVSYTVSAQETDGKAKWEIGYTIARPKGRLIARVPIYGKLRFTDREGEPTEKGVNVGDEWIYRSFIEGGTLATAIWTFEGITEEKFPKAWFPQGLPLEMTLEVFRTYKGDTDDPEKIPPIPGSLSVLNPKTGRPVEVRIFMAKDFAADIQYIPRQLDTLEGERLDLFEDLAVDGRLEIWLRCVQPAQYFGVAQPDAYFRARDASFTVNFAKGYLGIWLQMVLVVGFGVMFSTFLSGPIAALTTLGALVLGYFSKFMADLGASQFMSEERLSEYGREKVIGGGPVEAFIRLITQQNVTSEMEPGMRTTVAQMVDTVLGFPLWVSAAVLPDFGRFSFADYVAYGFDISANLALQCALRAMAFLLPLFVAGYFFLKTREVAR